MEPSQPTASDRRLYTADQVRHLDQTAIEDHDIPGIDLMERAGKATFDAVRERFADRSSWLVLCGGGNNGGDGYVIARLARKSGIDCRLAALKPPDALEGDAATVAQRWLDSGGTAEIGPPRDLARYDLIVDALLGTGLDRVPEGEYADAIGSVNASGKPVVAVDIPSGLHADTGCALGGIAVRADLTVTFIGRKRGLHTADGPDHTGEVLYRGLEVPNGVFQTITDAGILLHEKIITEKLPKRLKNSHKGNFGWILAIGGDRGMCGALRLCGEAALRSGAGKVTLATHPDHAAVLNATRPELMVRGVGGGGDMADLVESAEVVVLGTGLGKSAWSRSLFQAAIEFAGPMVLDADALNLAAELDVVDSFANSASGAVMTPHPAEAGRLLQMASRDVQGDRIGAAQALAGQSGAVVVLKGCGSVVAEPGGRYAVCPLGNPGMASAGTGDVLSGVIGALLAQGLEPWEAATVGVVAHAAAGDHAAARIGERGLMAGDLIADLPAVLNPD